MGLSGYDNMFIEAAHMPVHTSRGQHSVQSTIKGESKNINGTFYIHVCTTSYNINQNLSISDLHCTCTTYK